MKSLQQFVEDADEAAVKVFTERGELLSMYHVVDGDDREGLFMPPSPNKDVSVAMVRAALAGIGAKRVLFITEAWTASEAVGSTAVQDFAANNSLEHWTGHKKECLIYMAEDAEEGMLMASREIIREPSQPPRLGPLIVQPKTGTHEGRMIGLLPTFGRRH